MTGSLNPRWHKTLEEDLLADPPEFSDRLGDRFQIGVGRTVTQPPGRSNIRTASELEQPDGFIWE